MVTLLPSSIILLPLALSSLKYYRRWPLPILSQNRIKSQLFEKVWGDPKVLPTSLLTPCFLLPWTPGHPLPPSPQDTGAHCSSRWGLPLLSSQILEISTKYQARHPFEAPYLFFDDFLALVFTSYSLPICVVTCLHVCLPCQTVSSWRSGITLFIFTFLAHPAQSLAQCGSRCLLVERKEGGGEREKRETWDPIRFPRAL